MAGQKTRRGQIIRLRPAYGGGAGLRRAGSHQNQRLPFHTVESCAPNESQIPLFELPAEHGRRRRPFIAHFYFSSRGQHDDGPERR